MNKIYFKNIFFFSFILLSNNASAERMLTAQRNSQKFNELIEKGYVPFVGGEDVNGEERVVCRGLQYKYPGKEVGDRCHLHFIGPVKDYEIYMINKSEDSLFSYRWISRDTLNKMVPTFPQEMKEASHVYYVLDEEIIQSDFLREIKYLESTISLISRSKRLKTTANAEPEAVYIYEGNHIGHAEFDVESTKISENHYSFDSRPCLASTQERKDESKKVLEESKKVCKDNNFAFMKSMLQTLENIQNTPVEETEVLCKVSSSIIPAMKGNLNFKIIDLLFNNEK